LDKKILRKFLEEIARERDALHKGQDSCRKLSAGYEYIGLLGEWYFSKLFKLPIDFSLKSDGDSRTDFKTKAGSIDVKTARKPYNLLREINKPHSEIIVLAGYNEKEDDIYFLGWEYDKEMLKCPKKDFGYGVINHYKAADQLRSIKDLREMLNIN
jgi:hypothetical protein